MAAGGYRALIAKRSLNVRAYVGGEGVQGCGCGHGHGCGRTMGVVICVCVVMCV